MASSRPPPLIYPGNRKLSHAGQEASKQERELIDLEKRLEPTLNFVHYHAGNIIKKIAKDLASPAAQEELSLLPVFDRWSVWDNFEVSGPCRTMLLDKIKRYQCEYAHELATSGGDCDILVMWHCPPGSQHSIIVPEEGRPIMEEVRAGKYKSIDWDVMHAIEREWGDSDEPRIGGYYSRVSKELFERLKGSSPSWGIRTMTVVEPRLMTTEEQEDMKAYQAARRKIEEDIAARESIEKEQKEAEARRAADREHKERRAATYARATYKDPVKVRYHPRHDPLWNTSDEDGNPKTDLDLPAREDDCRFGYDLPVKKDDHGGLDLPVEEEGHSGHNLPVKEHDLFGPHLGVKYDAHSGLYLPVDKYDYPYDYPGA